MCRKQKALGAVLGAAGLGILVALFIGSPVVQFLLAAALILSGVFLLLR